MSSERKVVGNPAKRPGMVDWYAPLELMQTGVRTVIEVERTAGETGAHPVETRLVDRFTLGG